MHPTARLALLIVAILLFLAAAGEAAGWINWGNPEVVQDVGLAAFAASFIPPLR